MFHDDLQFQFVECYSVVLKYRDVEGVIQSGVTLQGYSDKLYWFQVVYLVHNMG
jgi:hypothetical protein